MPSFSDLTEYDSPEFERLKKLDPQKLKLINSLNNYIADLEISVDLLKELLAAISATFYQESEQKKIMSTFISIKVEGYRKGEVSSFGDEYKNPRSLLRNIKDYRYKVFRYKINNELDADYKPVERLEGWYRRRKAKKYGDRKIRHATGHMLASYASITYQNEVVEAIDDPKAAYHQTGTKRGLPKRSMIPNSVDEIPYVEIREVERFANEFIKKMRW